MKRLGVLLLCLILLLPGCTLWEEKNESPIAVITVNQNMINVGGHVVFSANESRDRDGKIIKYHWEFGDGQSGVGRWIKHKFTESGNFTVTLVVTDNDGAKAKENTTIVVNEYPEASIHVEKTVVKVNETVQFDATSSRDIDGRIREYIWDVGDNTGLVREVCPKHRFKRLGMFNVTLTVRDDRGAEDTQVVKLQVIKRRYMVYWDIKSTSIATLSNYTFENTTTNKTVGVNIHNLTMVEFNMTWNDDIPLFLPGNDLFSVKVRSPEGEELMSQSTSENISIRMPLGQLPEVLERDASSEEEIAAFVSDYYITSAGMGQWFVSVTCINAGGYFGNESILDQGNLWQMTVKA